MNRKTFLKTALRTAACLLAMLTLCILPALAEEPAQTLITVQGSGSVSAQPDTVTLMVNAAVTADTLLSAQTQVSGVVEDAIAALLALGIPGEDIVTVSYGCNPRYSYEESEPRLTGYHASHMLEITCRDIGLLDSVIAAVTGSGVAEINSVSYGIADRSGLYQQALELAVRAAQEKAQTLAAAGGKTLAGLISLTENQSYDARYAVTAEAASADGAFKTGIRSGSVSVSASVTAVYGAQ